MTEIRLPRLLDGNLNEKARLRPIRAWARLRLNALAAARITLDGSEPEVNPRDMAELYGPEGSMGIFRVSAVRVTEEGLREIELEHGLCTLEDDITPPDTVLQGPMETALAGLMNLQSRKRWELGRVESNRMLAETEADGANLLETLLAVLAVDEGLMLETDQRSVPWVLNLVRMPEEAGCECRFNRNLDGAAATLDCEGLCTRVTALLPDGSTVTKDGASLAAWGPVHRVIRLDENQNAEAETEKYLKNHGNPALTVELEAEEVSALTGEPLDCFRLGSLCRAALPEENAVYLERVIALEYGDLFQEPGRVKMTLGSPAPDTASLLAALRSDQRRTGGRLFRFIRETKNGVKILAEEILLRARKEELDEINGTLTEKISSVSVELNAQKATLKLKASQEYVDQQFSATELLLDGANARIDANALRIDEANKQITAAIVSIDGANARIDAEAKRIDENTGEITSAKVTIDGLKGEISQTVRKGDLISSINQSAEEIRISASRVNLDGYVTAKKLEAEYLTAKQIAATYITADEISSFVSGEIDLERVNADSGSIMNLYCDSLTVNSWPVDMGKHYHTFTPGADGTVTIGGPTGTPGSFKIADTQFYKNGVSAAERRGINSVTISSTGWENEYDSSARQVTVWATASNGRVGSYTFGVGGVYSDGAKSVAVETYNWLRSGAGEVTGVTVELSNGKSRTLYV